MQSPRPGEVLKFSDAPFTLAKPAEDVRGRTVFDACGDRIGRVHELMIDERERTLRFICVEPDGVLPMGSDHVLIPVEAITLVSSDSVRVDRGVDQVVAAPGCEPDLVDADYMARLYDYYYGYIPHWRAGYAFSTLPFHY